MADQIDKGKFRWDKSFRKKQNINMVNKDISKDFNVSNISGYRNFKTSHELKYLNATRSDSFRIRNPKRRNVDMVKAKLQLEKEQIRLEGTEGSSGGYLNNPDVVAKDKNIKAEQKEEHKDDNKAANQHNYFDGDAGNFQGGYEKVKVLKQDSIGTKPEKMTKYKIRKEDVVVVENN